MTNNNNLVNPVGVADYEERKQAKIDSLQERAEKARETAAQMQGELLHGHDYAYWTQPIHNTAAGRAFERQREKVRERFGKGVEMYSHADDLDRRAESKANNAAISSDDPEAIQKLQAKIDELEEAHARKKAANAALRLKNTEKGNAKLAELGFTEKQIQTLRDGGGFASWSLSSDNAEIKRCRERIEEIKSRAELVGWSFVGGKVVANKSEDRYQVIFDDIPDDETRTALKKSGFRWSRTNGAWQRMLNKNTLREIRYYLPFLRPVEIVEMLDGLKTEKPENLADYFTEKNTSGMNAYQTSSVLYNNFCVNFVFVAPDSESVENFLNTHNFHFTEVFTPVTVYKYGITKAIEAIESGLAILIDLTATEPEDQPEEPTPTEPDTKGEILSLYEENHITLSELATLAHDAGYISNPDKWEASDFFKLDIPISEKVDNWNTYFEVLLTVISMFLIPWNECEKMPEIDNHDNTPSGKTLKALFDDTEDEPEETEDSGEWNRPQPTEDHTSPTEPPDNSTPAEPIEPPETAVQPSESVLATPLTIYPETEKLDSKLELNFNACFYSFSVADVRKIAKMAEFSDNRHGTNAIDIMVANALYYMGNAEKRQDMAKYYFCGNVLSFLQKVSPEIEKRNKVLTAFCKANKATKDHDSTLISDYFPSENVHVIGNRFIVFAISGHVASVPTSQPEKAANLPRLIDTETTRENKIPLKLPSVSALKKYIKAERLQKKADGGAKFDESKKYVLYDFGEGLPLVNAEYLLICLQVLPDCQMFSTGEFTVLPAIGSDGSKCCMMPIKARDGYKKHKTDLTAFDPKKKTVKATTEKPVESSVNSAVSPTDTAEEAPEPVKVVSAPSDDVQKELENMGIQSVKFFWNGYKINDGDLIKWDLYANAKTPEAIQMTGVYTDLPRALFEVHNDSDPYTDYHCDDTATVTPEHPLFSYVLYAWETSRIRDINSSIKYKNKRISELQKAKGKATAEYIEQYQNEIKELEKELSALQSRRQKKAPQPTTDDLVKVAEMHLAERSARLKEDHEKELQEREKALKIKLEGEKLIDSVLQSFPIVEGQPVVTINWSEHPAFYRYEDGELTLSVAAADTLIKLLDVRTKSENRYFKLAFSVDCIAENGEKDRYQDYYDLGCNGENGGIIEHIRNYGKNILQFHREHPEGCQYAPEVERGDELIQFADWLETFVSAPTENVSGITMTKNPRFQNEDSDEIPQF